MQEAETGRVQEAETDLASVDAELLQLVARCAEGDAQRGGGAGLVVAVFLQGVVDRSALDLLTDATYGLGLQYRFTDTVALRGVYSRFEMDDIDVDLAQLQLRFDF